MSSRPAWSTRASSRTGTKNYRETLSQKSKEKKITNMGVGCLTYSVLDDLTVPKLPLAEFKGVMSFFCGYHFVQVVNHMLE